MREAGSLYPAACPPPPSLRQHQFSSPPSSIPCSSSFHAASAPHSLRPLPSEVSPPQLVYPLPPLLLFGTSRLHPCCSLGCRTWLQLEPCSLCPRLQEGRSLLSKVKECCREGEKQEGGGETGAIWEAWWGAERQQKAGGSCGSGAAAITCSAVASCSVVKHKGLFP